MSEEESEQPRYVTQDQHRTDRAELRGELKEEIAGLRQDIVGLTKTIEANQQAMMLRFEQVDQRFEQAERQRAEDRQVMLQQFQQVDRQLEQIDGQFSRHETRLLSLENGMRTTYVTLAVVVVGVAAQLFYTLLRFGFQPPTP